MANIGKCVVALACVLVPCAALAQDPPAAGRARKAAAGRRPGVRARDQAI